MKNSFLFIILFLIFSFNNLLSQSFHPYFGEIPPDSTAKIFARGIVSNGIDERDMTITPDLKEIYWSAIVGGNSFTTILFSKYDNGEWSNPQIANFAKNINYMFIEPAISPDGSKFFFVSDMKLAEEDSTERNTDIWVMDREGNDWGKPYNLGSPVNTKEPEFFPSIANSGNLYFTRDNPDGTSSIFVSEFKNNQYQEPRLLPEQINAGRTRFNAYIAKDESYIITPIFGLKDSFGGTDYYISFNKNGNWIGPFNMGNKINSESRKEWSAYVSPDDKYLFFMSARKNIQANKLKNIDYNQFMNLSNKPENGNSDIYWINAGMIKKIKEQNISNN